MKLNKLFMLGLAGLAFAACSSDDEPTVVNNDKDQALVISIAGISSGTDTRTSDKWDKDEDADKALGNIQKLTILLTDANGKLKYKSYVLEGENLTAAKGNGVKFIGIQGVSQVHAVANKEVPLDEGANISELSAVLSEQVYNIDKTRQVIYFGSDEDITPFKPEPTAEMPELTPEGGSVSGKGEFYYEANVNLMPAISRIQINKINIATSGEVLFPSQQDGDIPAGKFKLTWENFRPVLHGVYLNNFAKGNNLFAKTVAEMRKAETFKNAITTGQWLIKENHAAYAAYIKYENTAYGTLLEYPTTTTGTVPLNMPMVEEKEQCIAFNIFVNGKTDNPTIHFQFAKDVTGYTTKPTLANGSEITDGKDKEYIATAETNISYTLPSLESGFLFANISKLFTSADGTAELQLAPAKIYNMDVTISPVNMTIDLNNPKSYNLVVKITVEPFTEENIYPGLGE